jgi:hypothetical protein
VIHWTPEGYSFRTGLNWYINWKVKRFWFRLVWVSVDLSSYKAKSYYFRFRPFLWPWIILDTSSWDIIENYCFCKGLHVITREDFMDYIEPNRK